MSPTTRHPSQTDAALPTRLPYLHPFWASGTDQHATSCESGSRKLRTSTKLDLSATWGHCKFGMA